ncbi:MAG: Gfo/Idh/MocA family oxidoreductase [Pseudomonadota bacterium]
MSAASARLRVAVVGAGLGSTPHFNSLADLASEVEVAWVCARNPERLAQAPAPVGAARTTRLDDVLEDSSVQAVLILTPPNTHLELARRAASAGKHVLVEKPLEVTLEKARALVEACESQGVHAAVMLQHRMRPAAQALAKLLARGEMGELVSGSASVRWWRPQSYYDEPGRGTWARDGGGVLMTQAIHTLDLFLQFTGLPLQVSGRVGTSPLHRMECEDTAAAVLHFPNGAIGTVEATTAAFPGYPERIELNFSKGSATLQGGELKVSFLDGSSHSAGAAEGFGSGANVMGFDHAAHRAVLKDFLDAVRSGVAPTVSARSALDVQELIQAIVDSSATGAPVSLSARALVHARG